MSGPLGEMCWGGEPAKQMKVGQIFRWPAHIFHPAPKRTFWQRLIGVPSEPSTMEFIGDRDWVVTRVDVEAGDFWAIPVDEVNK